jgi:glutamate-1-semialdehyde 2,1-aminomutase
VPFTTNHAGTMFGGFFTDKRQVTNYAEVMACDTDAFARFFHMMLELGRIPGPGVLRGGLHVRGAHG